MFRVWALNSSINSSIMFHRFLIAQKSFCLAHLAQPWQASLRLGCQGARAWAGGIRRDGGKFRRNITKNHKNVKWWIRTIHYWSLLYTLTIHREYEEHDQLWVVFVADPMTTWWNPTSQACVPRGEALRCPCDLLRAEAGAEDGPWQNGSSADPKRRVAMIPECNEWNDWEWLGSDVDPSCSNIYSNI